MANPAPGVLWRKIFTVASFFFFGLGSLILGLLVLPVVSLVSKNLETTQRISRDIVRASFRLFIWFMRTTGVLEYRIEGSCDIEPGTLVIANHPSLIDVIFIIAHIPNALCVVKEELSRNIFTRQILKTTGFPAGTEPDQLIEECVRLIRSGAIVVMFPEGTRTQPNTMPRFKHGASKVICRAICPVTPIFLTISPPTLSKGESWFKVPESKVHYAMKVSPPVYPGRMTDPNASERARTRACTEHLEGVFNATLFENHSDPLGVDGNDGKSSSRHQGTDREHSGA